MHLLPREAAEVTWKSGKRTPWSSENDHGKLWRRVRTCPMSRNSQVLRCIGPVSKSDHGNQPGMELPSSCGSCVYLTPRTPARTTHMIDDVHRMLTNDASAAVFTLGPLCLRCARDNGRQRREEQPFKGQKALGFKSCCCVTWLGFIRTHKSGGLSTALAPHAVMLQSHDSAVARASANESASAAVAYSSFLWASRSGMCVGRRLRALSSSLENFCFVLTSPNWILVLWDSGVSGARESVRDKRDRHSLCGRLVSIAV